MSLLNCHSMEDLLFDSSCRETLLKVNYNLWVVLTKKGPQETTTMSPVSIIKGPGHQRAKYTANTICT